MKRAIIILAAAVVALNANAGRNKQNKGKESLPSLIKKCQNLEKNPQIKKFKTEVLCRGYVTSWELKSTTDRGMDTYFHVTSDVAMKGNRYKLPSDSVMIDADPVPAKCNVYQEVRHDYLPVNVKLNSCAELEELAAVGRAQFCASRLVETPKSKTGKATGKVFSTCQ